MGFWPNQPARHAEIAVEEAPVPAAPVRLSKRPLSACFSRSMLRIASRLGLSKGSSRKEMLITPSVSEPLAPLANAIGRVLVDLDDLDEDNNTNEANARTSTLGPTFPQRAMSVMLPEAASCPQGLGMGLGLGVGVGVGATRRNSSSEEHVPRPARAMSMAEFIAVKPVTRSIALHPSPARAPPPYSAPSCALAAPSAASPAVSLNAIAAAASSLVALAHAPSTSPAAAVATTPAATGATRMLVPGTAEVDLDQLVGEDHAESLAEAPVTARLTRETLSFLTLQQFTLSEKLTRWANGADFCARPQPALETSSLGSGSGSYEDPRRRFASLARRTVV